MRFRPLIRPSILALSLTLAASASAASSPKIRTTFWARCYAYLFPAKKADPYAPGPIDADALAAFLRRRDGRPLFKLRGSQAGRANPFTLSEQLEFGNLRTRKNFAPVTDPADDFRPDRPEEFAAFVRLVTYRTPVRDSEAFRREVEAALLRTAGMRPSWGVAKNLPDVGGAAIPEADAVNRFLIEHGTTVAENSGFIAEPAYFNLIRNGILPVGNEHDLWAHAMLFSYREIREPTIRMANLFHELFTRTARYDREGAAAVFTTSADLSLAMRDAKLMKAGIVKTELTDFWGHVNESLTFANAAGGLRFTGGSGVFNAYLTANLDVPANLDAVLGLIGLHSPDSLFVRNQFGLSRARVREWVRTNYGMELATFADRLEELIPRVKARLVADPNFPRLSADARERLLAETLEAEERALLGGKTFTLDRRATLGFWNARLDDLETTIRGMFPAGSR